VLSLARWAAAFTLLCNVRTAWAMPIEDCVGAHTQGQQLQTQGSLVEAIAAFHDCASSCPAQIAEECAALLFEARRALPTVVFAVRRGNEDVRSAELFANDTPIADALNGRPVALDPGPYRIRVVVAGAEPVELELTLRQGEKDRLIGIDIPVPKHVEPVPPPALPMGVEPARRWPVWVAGGFTVAATGSFVGLGLWGREQESKLDACKPNCSRAQVDTMRERYLGADISLAAAVVGLGATTFLWLYTPSGEARVGAQVGLGPGGQLALQASGRF
jgi:hypothetical protein